jgi:hypothetical protein
MSEFKFSCPKCHQNIQATSEYSGLQINCPACQTPLVVPAAPGGPPPAPAGPPPAHGSVRLAKAVIPTGQTFLASPFVRDGMPVVHKKSRGNLYAGLALGAVAIAAGIYFGPKLMEKYHQHQEATAAAQAPPTNEPPPPPPPELTADEILQKVTDTYKGMTDYATQGESVAAVDASAITHTAPNVQTLTTKISLQLGRPSLYRMDWERNMSGTTLKGAAWSSGKGDMLGYGANAAAHVKDRDTALTQGATVSGTLCVMLAQLFFSQTNSVATDAKDFARTNGPDLNSHVNGQDCYVLDGQLNSHDVLLWVNKKTFMIPQIELVFGGKLDESAIKTLPYAQKQQLISMSKLKGNITETYQDLRMNQNLAASAFESPYVATSNPEQQQQGRPGRMMGQGQTRGATSPTQLTRRVRDLPQQ